MLISKPNFISKELPESETWDIFREVSADIVTHSDDDIRDLHAKMTTLLAQAEMQLGEWFSKLKSFGVKSKTTKATLLVTIYPDGPFNQRSAQVEADKRYQDILEQEGEIEGNVEIYKAKVHALESAVELLSREISYRIKK